MTRFAITLTAALLASASAATAMEGIDLDINNDGFATTAEIDQLLGGISASDFNILDLNKDNRLSEVELQSPGVRGIIGRYEATMSIVAGVSDVDTDGNRFLSLEELQAEYPGLTRNDFRDMDVNDDRRLDATEFYSPRSQAIVTRYEMAPTQMLTIMDVDGDGDFFASFDELKASYPGLSKSEFIQIDRNRDNRVHSLEFYGAEAQSILDRSRG